MPDASPAAAAGALLALWNDVDPALDAAYNDWHAFEHVPERLTVPGILWALRYARLDDDDAVATPAPPMPRYLTLYGLRDAQVLDGAAYRRLLDRPTPASRAMRPALRNLTRWVCSLDVQGGIERFERLAVRTVARAAARSSVTSTTPAGAALLVATRLPEAAALPWLTGGPSRPIDGDRLEGLAFDAVATPAAAADQSGATVYGRLPIGTPNRP